MLEYLSKDQVTLNHTTQRLNYSVKQNQAYILQMVLLNEDFSSDNEFYDTINESIKTLHTFVTSHKELSYEFVETFKIINKRVIAYKLVEKSLIDAIASQDKDDIHDALIGFNDVTRKFNKDTTQLANLAQKQLLHDIANLTSSNNLGSRALLFAFIFSFVLIAISVSKFMQLHNRLKSQLLRTQQAEINLQKAQAQLLKYNDDLESEITKKTHELHSRVYTNFLSNLPNRNRLLEDIITHNFKMIALLNIDKFQSFNDIYGEEIGNIALKLTAEFLNTHVESSLLSLYHINGDEFAILPVNSDTMSVELFTNTIENLLNIYKSEIFTYEEKSFRFLMSAGISFTGEKKILAYADMALKDAKKRNIQLSIFNDDKELEKVHQDDLECHKKLLFAMKNDSKNILSYFQVIVPIQDKTQALKYESLVRIKDAEDTIISPFKFLDVAKSNRIYYKITQAVLKNSLAILSQYQVPVSINFSLSDIKNQKTMQHFFNTIEKCKYNHLLTIELLETEDFTNYQMVYDFCVKVRSYGIKISLDDFGSGYSNFSHILNLPIDYIKIDASLISNIDRNHNSRIMVETIVNLAKKLHIQTIAEFVSSQEILDIVTDIGVDYAQGFHLGKPESPETIFMTDS